MNTVILSYKLLVYFGQVSFWIAWRIAHSKEGWLQSPEEEVSVNNDKANSKFALSRCFFFK